MTLEDSTPVTEASPTTAGPFSLAVTDVTRTRELEAPDFQRATPAGDVARAVAARMALPDNVPWVLRDNRTGAYLVDRAPIGEQVESGASLTVTPATHLGAGSGMAW
jgi:hypothetical protein